MMIRKAVIDFYRNLSLGKQRFITGILYGIVNMPVVAHIYHLVYSRRISRKIRRFPTLLMLETCNICNLKCVMCPYTEMTRPKSTMSMELYRKIIDDASRIGMTDVCLNDYGEPLLDRLLFERVAYARSKGMRVGFNSNGTLLLKDDNIKRILDSRLDWIAFSVDAVIKQTYEKIRVGAEFEQVVAGIDRLSQTKRGMGLTIPEVQISCCVQAENYAEMNTQKGAFYRLFKYADVVSLSPVSIRGDKAERLSRKLDFRTPVDHRRHTYPCHTIFNSITVIADGGVVLCCIDYDGKIRFGDLNNQTLTQVWESEPYRHIRRLHLDGGGADIPMCRDCKEIEVATFRWFI